MEIKTRARNAKKSFPYAAIALIAVAVLIIGMLVYSLLGTLGLFGRLTTVAKTTNYSVSANEMKVYEYHVAQNQLYTEYLYYSYGLYEDTYGYTKMYSTPDAFINAMLPTYVTYNVYAGQANTYASEYLLYCELSDADSTFNSYDEAAVDADVDAYIAELKLMAKANGVTLGGYLSNWIGAGVSESDVRSAMEKYFVATEYAEARTEAIKDSLTDEELKAFIEEHKADFYKSKYSNYPIMDKAMYDAFLTIGTEDSEFTKVTELKDMDAVKTAIAEYLVNKQFDELYNKHVLKLDDKTTDTDTDTDTDTETNTEAETNANGAVAQTEDTEIDTETETETETNVETDADKAAKAEVKQKVLETILALNKVGEYTEHYTSTSTGTDKDAYTIVTTLNKTAETQIKKVVDNASSAYVDLSKEETAKDATNLVKWLFDVKNPAAAGDFKLLSQENTSESSTSCTSTAATDKKHTYSTTPNDGATDVKKVYKCTNAGCSATKTVTTSYTWYLVEEAMTLDHEKTKEAYYNLFADDTTGDPKKTGKEKAEAMLADLAVNLGKTDAELKEFLKGIDTYKDALDAGTMTDRTLAENVTPGNFNYWAAYHAKANIGTSYYYEAVSDARDEDTPAQTDGLFAWLYDETRAEGDTAVIAADIVKDGKTENKGHYVVYFVGENEETYKRTARASLAEERLKDELEAAKTTYKLEMDTESTTEENHEGHDHD